MPKISRDMPGSGMHVHIGLTSIDDRDAIKKGRQQPRDRQHPHHADDAPDRDEPATSADDVSDHP